MKPDCFSSVNISSAAFLSSSVAMGFPCPKSIRARAILGLLAKNKVKDWVLLGAFKRSQGAAAEAVWHRCGPCPCFSCLTVLKPGVVAVKIKEEFLSGARIRNGSLAGCSFGL